MATARETASDTSAAFQAVIRSTPSRMNSEQGKHGHERCERKRSGHGIENWAIHGSPRVWKWGSVMV